MSLCSMQNLIEAAHDERLGSRELASVGRHLATCNECKAYAKELVSLRARAASPRRPVSELEHQRGRVRLLREAALPPLDTSELIAGNAKRRRIAPVSEAPIFRAPLGRIGAAVALCLVLLGVFVGSRRLFHEGQGSAPRLASSLHDVVSRITLTVVAGDSNARFERSKDGGLELVTLAEGVVRVRVHHLRSGERFVVKTADAEVEVRGTRFDVEASNGSLVRVSVSEGVVELRRGRETRLLTAGSEWRPPVALAVAPPGEPERGALPPVRRGGPVAVTSAAQKPSRANVAQSPASAASSSEPASASQPPAPADDAEAFRAGMARLEKGDFGQAAADLGRFAAAHPKDPRAEDAAFLQALSLSRAGRPDDAAASARAYLDRFPNGYRRAEAEKLLQKR